MVHAYSFHVSPPPLCNVAGQAKPHLCRRNAVTWLDQHQTSAATLLPQATLYLPPSRQHFPWAPSVPHQKKKKKKMPVRAFYSAQALENCKLLFAGKNPKMIFVNEDGNYRIFIISATTGELLLEHQGTDESHICGLLGRTEVMLSAQASAIRRGVGPIIEPPGRVKSEIDELKEMVEELKKKWETETAVLRSEVSGLKRENELLRVEMAYHRTVARMDEVALGRATPTRRYASATQQEPSVYDPRVVTTPDTASEAGEHVGHGFTI
jgi:hypothetical protein